MLSVRWGEKHINSLEERDNYFVLKFFYKKDIVVVRCR